MKCLACQEHEAVKNDRCEACLDDAYDQLSFEREREKMLNSWKHLAVAASKLRRNK